MDYRIVKYWSLIPEEKKICVKCGKKLSISEAEIHHKNGKRYDNKPENLEMFCKPCHRGGNENLESMIGISLRLPSSLLQQVEEKRVKIGISQSELIRNMIKEYFKKPSS